MLKRDGPYWGIERFERFEYTNNIIYEFFKRTLNNGKKIEEYEYIAIIEHTLKLKNVILFENDKIKFTLQDVIYNAFPKLYLDVMSDVNIKDKMNFSMEIEDFLFNHVKEDFKKVIYKDSNKNEYVELNYEDLMKKIDETYLYKKINMRYQRKQLNIKESNFINIYDLNINLPDEEILEYILRLKRQHKKARTEEVNGPGIEENLELKKISEEEKNKIKSKKRRLQYEEESIIEYRTFLKTDTLKDVSKKIIDDKDLIEEFRNFKELERLNLERITLEERKKNLKYKPYIYNPRKLADILFVYDYMEKEKKEKIDCSYNNIMNRIQYFILYYIREYIEIIDYHDLKGCNLSKNDCIRILELKENLYSLFKFIPDSWGGYDKEEFSKVKEEDIAEMNKIMNDINKLMNEKSKKLFLPYIPYVSERTLYKYYEIAKFYIDEENWECSLIRVSI